MKSEKARQELDDGSWKVEVGFEDEEFDLPYYAVRVDVAQYAVEIAEQEAEERMRGELTRWHDPTVELPEDAKTVLVKYVVPGESSTYYTTGFYLDGGRVMPSGWMTAVKVISGVIGWREIHE